MNTARPQNSKRKTDSNLFPTYCRFLLRLLHARWIRVAPLALTTAQSLLSAAAVNANNASLCATPRSSDAANAKLALSARAPSHPRSSGRHASAPTSSAESRLAR